MSEEELEEIRRRRMLELQRQIAEAQRQEEIRREMEAQKQAALRQILTPEARERLANLKMVRPAFAEQLEAQLIQLAQSGRVKLPITDDMLKRILLQLQGSRRETRVKFR
ncbi:MAG: DNA-binding protein [Candidatus Freyarchaeota archaeon]|nr:DNA-binding protein [Candidatus Freyrarchaeum guaymaensis]